MSNFEVYVMSAIGGGLMMFMKRFALMIDHKNKRIIHGEIGPAYKIESVTGLKLKEYESIDGCNSELKNFQLLFNHYTICDTYAAWEEIKPGYLARIAELRRQGIDIRPSYYD